MQVEFWLTMITFTVSFVTQAMLEDLGWTLHRIWSTD